MTTHTRRPRVLFREDFAAGLHAGRWELRPTYAFAVGDGLVARTAQGIAVTPSAVDPATGEPSFARPDGPEPPSAFLRWAAVARVTTAAGWPGFAAHASEPLAGSVDLAVNSYGTAATADPVADVRQGAGALFAFDRETGLVFDFAVTANGVYAIYERLPMPGKQHRAFSCVVRLANVFPGASHRCAIELDSAQGTVRWLFDGQPMLTVTRLGRQGFPDSCLLWAVPGEEEIAIPRQLAFGLCLLADAPHGQGVRLAASGFTVTGASE